MICYGHWVLHLVLSDTMQGYDLLRALGSASYVFRHETGGTICYGHWVLHLVLSDTRQGVRFVMCIGFCILCYQTRDRGYDLLRALGSSSCVIRHETGGTICYGHWVLHLVSSDMRQRVGFVTGIGFCILCYQARDRGHDLLRASGFASYFIRHETGGTICDGHWVLHLVLSDTRQGIRFVLRASGSASCVIRHQTGGTICYGPWVLHLVLSDTRQGVRFVTGIEFCILCYQTPCKGTIGYGHWGLHLVFSDTRQGLRFVTGIGFCILCHQTRDRGYDLFRALGSASCVSRHQTGGTICYGHWVLHLVLSDTRQGVRFVTGIGFCILSYQTRDRGYDLLRALGLHLVLSDTRQGVRFVTGIGFCVLCYQTRDTGYDLLQVLSSASCVIRHQAGGMICYGHWVLHLVLSDTRQGVRFVAGIWFCILCYQTPNSGYDL